MVFTCSYPSCGEGFSRKSDMKRHLNNTHLGQKRRCPFADCRSSPMRKDKLKEHMKKRHGLKFGSKFGEYQQAIALQSTGSGEAAQYPSSATRFANTEDSMPSEMSMTSPNRQFANGSQYSAQHPDHNFGRHFNPTDYSLRLPYSNSILPSQPNIQVTAPIHTTALQTSLPLRLAPPPYSNVTEFEDAPIFTDWMGTAFGDNGFDLGVGD